MHDVSDGGIGVALAEMALRSEIGFEAAGVGGHAELFSEAPSRVVVCVEPQLVDAVVTRARAADVDVSDLGTTGGDHLVVEGLLDVAMADALATWRGTIADALGA